MRLYFPQRPVARRPRPLASSLAVLAAVAPSLSQAINFTAVPAANLDFSNLGSIGIAGDFDGISLYEFEEQVAQPLSTNGSGSLFTQLPNGLLVPIAGTDASILAMCPITFNNGTESVIIGGNFTSLDGLKSTAIALYNTNTSTFTPLDGLEGEVNALLCDQDNGTVYVGGSFQVANSTNAIAWLTNGTWSDLPFAGFNGPVDAITKASDGHIIFGGGFTGLGNVSTPSQPNGQSINLSSANITAYNTASTTGFNDPKNIVCPTGYDGVDTTWLLADNAPGFWQANFGFGFEPTKLRLWNTHLDGRGTKSFYFLALPINGIMNFTYVDPATGKNASCTNECPLSNDANVDYQDFYFVDTVGMNSFQISISDWYGTGAGLAGIELFQDNIFAFAIETLNEPLCDGVDFPSSATATGPWSQSPSLQSDSLYLQANLAGPITSKSASVVFVPDIIESGNYSVNMYTPGCIPDGTCSTRGRINVTGTMSAGTAGANFTTSLYQTNDYAKYDQIYFGYIDKTSDSFQPSVTITPLDGQDINEMTIVAQKVGFTLINSTGGLNGLFDFDPSQTVFNASTMDNSAINQLGASFDYNTNVNALATSGTVTYIGGNFTSDDNQNVVAINTNNEVISLSGGLNGQVLDMYLQNTTLFVGGDFTSLQANGQDGLNYVASYDTNNNTWISLGAGVDSTVEYVAPFQANISNTVETAIALTGSFSECKAFGDFQAIPVNGFAVWVPSKQNWLQNLGLSAPGYSGILTAALVNLANGGSLFAGSISSAQLGASGAATLTSGGLGQFPVSIQSQAPASTQSRRDVSSQDTVSGVVTGAFYNQGSSNITILAGHFSAQSSNGSTINNLILIDGNDKDSVSGLGSSISSSSAFTAVALSGSTLFAGGSVSGTIDGNDINGIIAYDVVSKSFTGQPAPISGGNNTVSAMTVRSGTSEVYVGGSFEQAGALACPGVCLYNAGSSQWIRPGNSLGGRVNCFVWYTTTLLLAGGDLLTNGTVTNFLATYDVNKQTWQNFAGADKIPGPVTAITPGSSDNSQLWISGNAPDGSVFLMKYDGSEWQNATQLPSSGSVIQSLQVFTVTKSHGKSDLLDTDEVLMLTGSIPLPNVGTVAAVIYNGTTYEPYALTTSSGGQTGSIAKIFSQNNDFFSSSVKHLPLVFVVLIGLAVALALILILVATGIMLDRLRKRREGYTPAPTSMYDRGRGIQRIPPRELLESLGKSRPGAAPHV